MEMQSSDPNINRFLRERAYLIGQSINYYHTRLNRLLFNLPKDTCKPLPHNKAIDKGAEFMSECLLYLIVLGLPIFEWFRGSAESKQIEFEKNKMIRRMKNDMDVLIEYNVKLKQELDELNKIIDRKIEIRKKAKLYVNSLYSNANLL